MNYFPFYMDMRDKTCLIVGGGRIALHKAKVLLDYPVNIRVVAPVFYDEFIQMDQEIEDDRKLQLWKRCYVSVDLQGVDFVISATDDPLVQDGVHMDCKSQGKLLNMVDDPDRSDFIFPAIWKKKDLMLTVSTGGKSPVFAAELKEELNQLLPDYYSDMVELLGEIRDEIKEVIPSMKERKDLYQDLIRESKELKRVLSKEEIQAWIDERRPNK